MAVVCGTTQVRGADANERHADTGEHGAHTIEEDMFAKERNECGQRKCAPAGYEQIATTFLILTRTHLCIGARCLKLCSIITAVLWVPSIF